MGKYITVLGGGAWGTALACIASRTGNHTTLWCRDPAAADEMNQKRRNEKYLPGLILTDRFEVTSNLEQTVTGADIIFLACPAQVMAGFCKTLDGMIADKCIAISAAKGIDNSSGLRMSEIIGQHHAPERIATLSGPSFARDAVSGLPTAVTVASNDLSLANNLCQILSGNTFRCYASCDLTGVELGGALKNVLALAVGIARGLKLGASAEAALIARGFAEMNRLAMALGAQPETLTGLSGLGDLVLTCSSTQSRNFTYGVTIGQGDNLAGLKLAEGAHTARIAASMAHDASVETPIIQAVANVLDQKISASGAVDLLLARPLKAEH